MTEETQPLPEHQPPTPTLGSLLQMLYLRGMLAAGEAPFENPNPDIDPQGVRFHLQLLEMLRDKTQGNRNPEEEETLDYVLMQLRGAWKKVSGETQ